jgi:maltose O-acetyltransferase
MEMLKAFADQARPGDRAQQAIVVGFFRALARILSDAAIVAHSEGGVVNAPGPVRVCGRGQIMVRGTVTIGVYYSPYLLQGAYLEARSPTSRLFIDDSVYINNGASIISEGASISIGKRCLIGPHFSCADSNFHGLRLDQRFQGDPDPRPVVIEDDVFIGEGVKILKGVRVGAGSVIAAGAVLFPGFTCPPNSTVRGNPAMIVRSAPTAEAGAEE